MKISVIGTGAVGRRLAAALESAGHEVLLGTRDPAQTLARTETSATGTPPIGAWHEGHPGIPLVPLAEAGNNAQIIVNANQGAASLAALEAAGPGRARPSWMSPIRWTLPPGFRRRSSSATPTVWPNNCSAVSP